MSNKEPSITCPECGMTSYHPKDVEYEYCANCNQFHDIMARERRLQQLAEEVVPEPEEI